MISIGLVCVYVSCWCFKLCVRVLGFDLVFVFRVGVGLFGF